MRTHARVAFVYTLLALILTWPLVAHFGTHVPGDGIDDPSLAWNLWWAKHALVDQPQNPFTSNWQFWPIGINLAFYTLTLLNGMLSVPLQMAFGLIPAYNLLLLSSFVMGGLGAYLLGLDFLHQARDHHAARAAAFVGGLLFAFASAKMFYAALGQGNIASSQWAPFAVLYIVRAARPRGKPRDAVLAALFLVFQAYAELTYASFLVVFAGLALLWGAVVAARADRGHRSSAATRASVTGPGRLAARFALMAVLFATGIGPVLANMAPDLRAEGDFFTAGGGFADVFSADLAGYLVPTQLHPLAGGLARDLSASRGIPIDKGQHIYVGIVALGLALIGVRASPRRNAVWLWCGGALLFFLLTLGPSLRIAGADTGLPLPFRIFEQLPFFKGNRYPSRYSVMLLLCLAPLVSAGAQSVMGGARLAASRPLPRWFPTASTAALSALILVEHLSTPLPVFDLRVPRLYEQVAAQPGDFALLEVPLGWRNGARVAGKQDILIMEQLWYQTTHGKRVLGGNTSRNPEYKFQDYSENPTLARLIATTNAADLTQHAALRETLAALPITGTDRRMALDWAAFTGIRYVMVHLDKIPADTEQVLQELLPLTLLGEEGALRLYRVDDMPAPRVIDLNSDLGRLALGEGWSPPQGGIGRDADGVLLPVVAHRREVRLILPLRPDETELAITASAFMDGQIVTLEVDGRCLGALPLGFQPETLRWQVPPDAERPLLSDVRLKFARTIPVAELAVRISRTPPLSLLVRSAGQETGDFAHIYVNGVDVSPNGRGYNLVALRQDSAEVLDAASFDTHEGTAASRRMAEWLAALPDGVLIAGAVRDEASQNLDEVAVTALRDLGLSSDLRGHFRWGHGFIVAKVSTAVALQEQIDAIRPVQLSWGPPLTGPVLASQVFSVELAP